MKARQSAYMRCSKEPFDIFIQGEKLSSTAVHHENQYRAVLAWEKVLSVSELFAS
jgi:hypothetical protein